MRNSSVQKRSRFSIGLSGVNFLKAASCAFQDERKIYVEHNKRFPDRESGIKSERATRKLSEAVEKTIMLIKDIEKSLKF